VPAHALAAGLQNQQDSPAAIGPSARLVGLPDLAQQLLLALGSGFPSGAVSQVRIMGGSADAQPPGHFGNGKFGLQLPSLGDFRFLREEGRRFFSEIALSLHIPQFAPQFLDFGSL
jgi:hypothetical protein